MLKFVISSCVLLTYHQIIIMYNILECWTKINLNIDYTCVQSNFQFPTLSLQSLTNQKLHNKFPYFGLLHFK